MSVSAVTEWMNAAPMKASNPVASQSGQSIRDSRRLRAVSNIFSPRPALSFGLFLRRGDSDK